MRKCIRMTLVRWWWFLTMSVNRKIENFIRTKYESKRWVMDGEMPDPSALDDGDDDVVSDRMIDQPVSINH